MSIKDSYSVKPIKPFETHEWLLKKHYARRIPSISYAFGLYDSDGILQGVCTFGKPASPTLCDGVCGSEYSVFVYELNRLVIDESAPKNTASYFVSKCISMVSDTLILVSYADKDMGHIGLVYQASNWIYTGDTKERTDIGSEDGTHSRHYDKTIDYKINRKKRSSKYRYIYFVNCSKKIRSALNYPILPYPKGVSSRYDASYKPSTQTTLF
jgi:hypothetical protein